MKIQKIASSTVIITTDDCKILCDPWIENGEYFGSWSIELKDWNNHDTTVATKTFNLNKVEPENGKFTISILNVFLMG